MAHGIPIAEWAANSMGCAPWSAASITDSGLAKLAGNSMCAPNVACCILSACCLYSVSKRHVGVLSLRGWRVYRHGFAGI